MIVRLALRNARRNVRRTLLTAATVVIGVALCVVALSWMNGIFSQMYDLGSRQMGHVRVVTTGFATREELLPLDQSVEGVAARVRALADVEGVEFVAARTSMPVTIAVGDVIGDAFAVAVGAPTAWYREELRLDTQLVEGRLMGEEPGELVLGVQVARDIGAKLGDEVLLLGATRDGAMSPVEGRLVGIVAGGSAPIDQAAFLPLERVQWMADTEDGALELLVYGSDRDDAQTLAAAVAGSPGAEGLVVQAWSTREPLASMSAIGGAVQWMISGLIITLCALAVWNTMTMSVRERTGEIGVLRALGMTAPEVVGLFVLEGVLIALLGGAVGAALGGMGGLWLESHGISFGQQVSQNIALPVGDTLRADMTWGIGGLGLVVAVVTALVGTAVPAIAAAAVQPVEAMRARR